MSDMIGRKLGQYEITGLIGEGGMATVYRARQESVGRDVAIKIIDSKLARQLESRKRFQREAKVIASLNHANILKIVDFGELDDILYLVMELQTGGTLSERIQQGGLHHYDVTRVIDQVASALDYAHEQGVIHRDLKPQNILLDSSGNAVIADFGLVKLRTNDSTSFTQDGHALGTPKYMAPEQWGSKELDGRADIYALGVIAYEMLTGHVPFDAETPMQLLNSHLNDSPQPIQNFAPTLPSSANLVVQKALAKKPEQRFGRAILFANALREALSSPAPSNPSGRSVLSPLSVAIPLNWGLKKGIGIGQAIPQVLLFTTIIFGSALILFFISRASGSRPQPTDWTATQRNFDGIPMVLVPAGCFKMGSSDYSDEIPFHEVCITQSFWIDKYEVRNSQFEERHGRAAYQWFTVPDRPRTDISWQEAATFCGERGARLPTEAEWEYAARGPENLTYPWGNRFMPEYVVYKGNSGKEKAVVGSRPGGVSWVGTLDMSGNVWEWVADWYDGEYYAHSPKDDPVGPSTGQYRVLRGGSWGSEQNSVRASERWSVVADNWESYIGFRCARDN